MKKFFGFDELDTNFKKEIIGGLTTFLSMAYILAVNPSILSLQGIEGVPDEMKMDINAVFVATCLAAFVGCLLWRYCEVSHRFSTGHGAERILRFYSCADDGYSMADCFDRRSLLRSNIRTADIDRTSRIHN
jgi:Permeases